MRKKTETIETDIYKAKTFDGKEIQGELKYDGLSCYIEVDYGYGSATVRVNPNRKNRLRKIKMRRKNND